MYRCTQQVRKRSSHFGNDTANSYGVLSNFTPTSIDNEALKSFQWHNLVTTVTALQSCVLEFCFKGRRCESRCSYMPLHSVNIYPATNGSFPHLTTQEVLAIGQDEFRRQVRKKSLRLAYFWGGGLTPPPTKTPEYGPRLHQTEKTDQGSDKFARNHFGSLIFEGG